MSVNNLPARGFGPSASIAFVVTRGYSIAAPVATPPNATLTTRGYGANATIGGIVTRFYNIGAAFIPTPPVAPNGGGGAIYYRQEPREYFKRRKQTAAIEKAIKRAEAAIQRAETIERQEIETAVEVGREAVNKAKTAVDVAHYRDLLNSFAASLNAATKAVKYLEAKKHSALAEQYAQMLKAHIDALEADDEEVMAILLS